tara:strand:+ start:600 stop:1088 length:489 start_codon:yes stop_codon:yes gene_type:complete
MTDTPLTDPSIKHNERSLHLVDVENLLQDPFCEDVGYIKMTISDYKAMSAWQVGDQVLVAANRRLCKTLAFLLQTWNCRLFTAEGPDGADLRLLKEGSQEKLLNQFDQLVVGSGDGIFADAVALSRKLGLKSVTVARSPGLSRKLAAASDEVRMMTSQPLAV